MHTKLNKIKNNSQKESHFNPHKYKIKIIQPTIPFQFIARNRIRKNKFSLFFHSPSRHSVFLIVPFLYSSPRRPIFSSKFVSSIRVSIKTLSLKSYNHVPRLVSIFKDIYNVSLRSITQAMDQTLKSTSSFTTEYRVSEGFIFIPTRGTRETLAARRARETHLDRVPLEPRLSFQRLLFLLGSLPP